MARGDRFFFHPTATVYDRPDDYGLRYESLTFNSRGGTALHGWFFPAVGEPRGTIVHCHGNAGNITGHYRFVAWLPRRGFNVFCFDYRGFGQSAGHPTREGAVMDVHAAVDHVRDRPDVATDRIVLFGQSLGGTLALVAAAGRDDLAGVAVEGAFATFQSEARHVCRRTWWLWGVSGMVPRIFIAPGCDPIEVVERIGPIAKLFICGTADRIVDYRETVALHDRAGDPKELWVLEDGGHTTALIDDEPDSEVSGDPQGPVATKRGRFHRFCRRAVDAGR
ncbi:MAG: alpha/beta hydrolase [bacterium]|nr:alpha/beta hydrolase [bacterium]